MPNSTEGYSPPETRLTAPRAEVIDPTTDELEAQTRNLSATATIEFSLGFAPKTAAWSALSANVLRHRQPYLYDDRHEIVTLIDQALRKLEV